MHLMKDYEDIIMGYKPEDEQMIEHKRFLMSVLTGNPLYGESAVSNELPTSKFPNTRCNCTSINYCDYVRKDIEQTKEAAVKMNKIKKVNIDPRKFHNTGDIYAVINGKAYAPEMIRMIHIDQAVPGYEFTITPKPMYAVENTMLSIKDVIFNPPATIVFWGDGSKTVVKCQDGEEFDPEKGITMAFFKKMHGNKGHYFEEIKKWLWKYSSNTSEGVNLTFTFKDWCQARRVTEEILRLKTEDEVGKDAKTNTVWILFYARADRGEDEGYTQHPVAYKHKSSAVRAAKRLISKLPNGVDYEWFVDEVSDLNV